MSMFVGLGEYTTTGSVGVAIIAGVGGNLAFQNFETNADASELTAALTINGDLAKRQVDLGVLPQTSGSFSVAFPDDTDISLFNVLVVRAGDTAIAQARIV